MKYMKELLQIVSAISQTLLSSQKSSHPLLEVTISVQPEVMTTYIGGIVTDNLLGWSWLFGYQHFTAKK